MLPGLAEIAAQPVTRTTAAELPAHVQPGRTWRVAPTGRWHLPRSRNPYADALCGAFIFGGDPEFEAWFAVDDAEPVKRCRRCLAAADRIDATVPDEVDA